MDHFYGFLLASTAVFVLAYIFFSFLAASAAVFILSSAWILNWIWITPKKLEKRLRKQGLGGNRYRIFYGDTREMTQMDAEAKTKPISLGDDIVPRVIPFIEKTVITFGKYSFMWDGIVPSVNILDPELVSEVFTRNYVYQKNPNSVGKLLAKGLQSYDTDKWTKHRRLLNPAFHMEKLKHMLPAFDLSCREMLSQWDEIVPSEGSCEVDVWPYLQTLTSDAISRTAFGSNYEEGRRIFELQKDLAVLIFQGSRSLNIPGTGFLPTKRNRRIRAIAKEAQSSVLNIINNRVRAIQAGEPSGDDLLGILLDSNFKEIQQHGSKKFGMNFAEVIEECKLFYFAGQETTAALLVWTLILLSKHSDWQDRARAEVLQIFGHDKPDLEGLNHLKVVVMIINEVLRLYPVAVMIRRKTHEETTLRHLSLPPGTLVTLPAIMLHTDETIWGPDAKQFNPERFSGGISKATKGRLIYFPFGWGPRICIAQNFALLEAKMVLSQILQRFSFELSPSYAHAPNRVFALQPQYGAQLIFRKL